jgi:hypothetical protein
MSRRTFAGCQMRDRDGGEFGTAECAGEAEEHQGAVAQASQIGADRRDHLAQVMASTAVSNQARTRVSR